MKVKVTVRSSAPQLPLPLPEKPRVRIRVQPQVNPGATAAPAKRVIVGKVAAPEDTKSLLTLGEIDTKFHPRKWARWPNGSLVMNKNQKHVGRTLRCDDGQYHSLRWVESKAVYIYAGKHPWPKAMDVLVR